MILDFYAIFTDVKLRVNYHEVQQSCSHSFHGLDNNQSAVVAFYGEKSYSVKFHQSPMVNMTNRNTTFLLSFCPFRRSLYLKPGLSSVRPPKSLVSISSLFKLFDPISGSLKVSQRNPPLTVSSLDFRLLTTAPNWY